MPVKPRVLSCLGQGYQKTLVYPRPKLPGGGYEYARLCDVALYTILSVRPSKVVVGFELGWGSAVAQAAVWSGVPFMAIVPADVDASPNYRYFSELLKKAHSVKKFPLSKYHPTYAAEVLSYATVVAGFYEPDDPGTIFRALSKTPHYNTWSEWQSRLSYKYPLLNDLGIYTIQIGSVEYATLGELKHATVNTEGQILALRKYFRSLVETRLGFAEQLLATGSKPLIHWDRDDLEIGVCPETYMGKNLLGREISSIRRHLRGFVEMLDGSMKLCRYA